MSDVLSAWKDSRNSDWIPKHAKGFACEREVYDYIAKLYCERPPGTQPQDTSFFTYNFGNEAAAKQKAQDLDGLSDAIFLLYYQDHKVDGGKAFLDLASSNFSVEQWKKRLSYFGNDALNKTTIIPLFSAEDTANCGQGNGTPFLGHVLEGLPYFGTENYTSIESSHTVQHRAIYNSTLPQYSQVDNIQMGGFAWFKYACLKDRTFTDVARQRCDTLGFPYIALGADEIIQQDDLSIFPNPTSSDITFLSESSQIEEIELYDFSGRLIQVIISKGNQIVVRLANESTGIYLAKIQLNNGDVLTRKIVKR